jgi:glycosyltransferase involved in cell wall biosynthesis
LSTPLKKIAVLLHGSIKSDHRVVKTVITLTREYEIHLFYHGSSKDAEQHFKGLDNIELHPIEKRSGLISRVLRHSLFCYEYSYIKQIVLKTRLQFDFIWSNDLPTLYPAHHLAKKFKAKLIYDSHEIYVETVNQFFIKGSNPFKNIIFKFLIGVMKLHGTWIERRLIKSVDLMFTVNDSLKNYFIEKYRYNIIKVLMNLPSQNENQKNELVFDFRSHFNWSKETIVVLYQGALNHGRGLELLIDSFAIIEENYCLVILGNGLLKTRLKQKVHGLNLDMRVKFLDAVPLSQLSHYTKGADLGMNLLEPFNLSKKLASPNKLYEYIHAHIPVVASDTIENRKVYDKHQIGEICQNNLQDIGNKIKLVASQIRMYQISLERAKQEYSWENQEDMLLKLI